VTGWFGDIEENGADVTFGGYLISYVPAHSWDQVTPYRESGETHGDVRAAVGTPGNLRATSDRRPVDVGSEPTRVD
jgi:hypothetical protein